MQMMDALSRFERQLTANGRSAHAQAASRRDLAALARWLGNKADLSRQTPDVLAHFLTSDAVLRTPDGSPRAAITVNPRREDLRPRQVCRAVVLRLLCGIGVDQGEPGPADPVIASDAKGADHTDGRGNSAASGLAG